MIARFGSGLVLAATLAWAGPAWAQDATDAAPTESMASSTATEEEMDDSRARSHFRVGRSMYDAGRFAEAAVEFQSAYDLSHRSDLLYNVYLAHRDAQNEPAALAALRLYLAEVADAPDREHLEARLAALEASVAATERAEAEREAERVAHEAERAEAERRIEEERRRADANAARSRPLWPWALVGAGVALAAPGVVMGVIANSDAQGLRDACDPRSTPVTCNPSIDLERIRGNVQALAGAGDALWITGAVVGVTGLVLFFVLPDEEAAPASTPTPSVACGPTGCFGSLEVSF